jgi:hypothetical protein
MVISPLVVLRVVVSVSFTTFLLFFFIAISFHKKGFQFPHERPNNIDGKNGLTDKLYDEDALDIPKASDIFDLVP